MAYVAVSADDCGARPGRCEANSIHRVGSYSRNIIKMDIIASGLVERRIKPMKICPMSPCLRFSIICASAFCVLAANRTIRSEDSSPGKRPPRVRLKLDYGDPSKRENQVKGEWTIRIVPAKDMRRQQSGSQTPTFRTKRRTNRRPSSNRNAGGASGQRQGAGGSQGGGGGGGSVGGGTGGGKPDSANQNESGRRQPSLQNRPSPPARPVRGGNQEPTDQNDSARDRSSNRRRAPRRPRSTKRKQLKWSSFKHVGAFRLPLNPGGSSRFGNSTGVTAFNPNGNGGAGSLFVTGHAHHNKVAEVSIPSPKDIGIDVEKTGSLPIAKVLQPFGDPVGSLRKKGFRISGLAILNSQLAWTIRYTYNVASKDYPSHGLSTLKLIKPDSKGLWNIANAPHNMSAGYLCSIPPDRELPKKLRGMNLMSGQSEVPGRASSSAGPALFGFRFSPPFPKPNSDFASRPLVYYPLQKSFPGWGPANKVYDSEWIQVGGRECIAFLVRWSKGRHWYGHGESYPHYPGGDRWDSSKGYHAPPYVIELWLYDAKDLIEVAMGGLKPWSPRPYERIDLTKYLIPGNPKRSGMGLVYDYKRHRLFVLWANVDRKQSRYEGAPVVNVFDIK